MALIKKNVRTVDYLTLGWAENFTPIIVDDGLRKPDDAEKKVSYCQADDSSVEIPAI